MEWRRDMSLTDVGHAVVISYHAVHFVGIGIGKSLEVLSNARQQHFVIMISDAGIIKRRRCGTHIGKYD